MAILTKAQLEELNQSSFPNNSAEAITPAILREYNTATIDTLVDSLDTGSFIQDLSSLNAFTESQLSINSGYNAFTSSTDAKFATIGSQSGSWGGGGSINTGSFATTGSNIFTGTQTISGSVNDTAVNGIYFQTGSSRFFVGQRKIMSGGELKYDRFTISTDDYPKIIEISPQSGWIEVNSQTNYNVGLGVRGNLDVRNIMTQTGNGYVAQFDGFTASLQEGYAWVGKSGGTSVSVPTSSFAGVAPVGTATTGSNTFNGNQTITGSLNVSGSEYITGGNKLYIQRDPQGAQQYLRLGATDNTYNFAFVVTGSDTNPGQQVWGINTAGGTWANSFDAGVVFNSYVTASNGIRIQDGGTFSAPLQQGYVWVGDANGRTTTAPTSSFGGGGSTFPYTGNAQITGSLGISDTITINKSGGDGLVLTNSGINSAGTIVGNNNIQSLGQFAGVSIQANAQGSGSQYPGVNMIVAPNTYPTDIFGGYSILTEQGALAGTTFLGMAASTYSPQYGGTIVPCIIANGNNPDGNDTAMIWKADGTAEHWKKSDFKYGVDVTGSLNISGSTTITGSVKLTPASVSTNAGYPIIFVSGSTISKDSIDAVMYNPTTNTLYVSASTGQSNITATSIGFTSGSGAYGTYSSTISKTGYTNVIEGGNYIGLSGNPSKLGAPSVTSFTNPAILALSGSGQPYVAIELQASGSTTFTDGRVTIKRPLVVEGSITGSTTINGNTTITGSLNQANGNSQFNGNLTVSGAHLYINGVGDDAIQVTNGNINVAGAGTFGTAVNSNGQVNILGGAGLSISANLQGSGSAYSIATAMVDNTSDPTNVYSAWQLVDATTQDALAIAWNSYTPRYATSTAMLASPGQYNGSDVAFGFPSAKIDTWKPINFKAPATFTTGSNQQAGTATLDGGNPGTVTVSNSLVTANSIIMVSKQTLNHPQGYVAVSAKSAGSFTITSNHNGDADDVAWFIINNS